MIEVEKKFLLKEGDFERLTSGAEFLSAKTFADTYYDTANYSLTTKGIWLRKRDSEFQIKARLRKNTIPEVSRYNEIEDEKEIRRFLDLTQKGTLENNLRVQGYFPFCSFKTTRKKYQKENFILDFDHVDFGNFRYDIVEIELMVVNESNIDESAQKILDFAKRNNLEIKEMKGKCKEYLSRYSPDHYQALIKAGI